MSGKAPNRDQTSAQGSVDYNIITGKLNNRSCENVDSLGNTMLGTEVKERFSSMRQAFLKMDSNRDGRITANEVRTLCKQWNVPLSEADRVLEAADLDENGTMDFNEFAKRFDPDYDRPVDGDPLPMASSTAYGAIYDDRPIASSGWANLDDMEYSEEQVGAATRIQATVRGRQARGAVKGQRSGKNPKGCTVDRSRRGPSADMLDTNASGPQAAAPQAPSTPAGSGSRAAASIRTQELAQENADLKARVAELEDENAVLKKALAAAQEREAELAEQLGIASRMDKTQVPAKSGSTGGTQNLGGSGRGGCVRFQGGEDAEEEEPKDGDQVADVVIYSRNDCKKTGALMSELSKAGVNFDAFDFDKTKEYMGPLKACGFPPKGKAIPPVVVVRGKHAFWDDPGAAIAVHFPSMVIHELRKMGLACDQSDDAPQVNRDVSIDVEIAERFHNMQQAFLKLDDNKDGRVSKKELREMCKRWNISHTEAERVIREADFDANGTLDFREFARRFGR